MGVEPVEKSSKTPVGDLHRCWSQTVSSGTAESRENDVNTSDWWRTVKLPFVKEKQEASCGRPSLSGWGETAGRKPHLRNSERLSSKKTPDCPSQLVWPFDPSAAPPTFSITSFNTCTKYMLQACASVLFFFFLTS